MAIFAVHVITVLAVILPSILCDNSYRLTEDIYGNICDRVSNVKDVKEVNDCIVRKQKGRVVFKPRVLCRGCERLTKSKDLRTDKGLFYGICKQQLVKGKTLADLLKCIVNEEKKLIGKGQKLINVLKRIETFTEKCLDEINGFDVKSAVNTTTSLEGNFTSLEEPVNTTTILDPGNFTTILDPGNFTVEDSDNSTFFDR